MDAVGNQIVSDIVKATEPLTNDATLPAAIGHSAGHTDVPPGTYPLITNPANHLRIPIATSDDVVYSIVNDATAATGVGGTLMRNGVPVFHEGFYKGKQVNFEIIQLDSEDSGIYSIRVFIMPREGGNTFGISGSDLWRDYVARPLALIND